MGEAPVTDLLEPYVGMSTLSPSPRPTPADVRIGEEFYLYGPPPADQVAIHVIVPDPTGRLHRLASTVARQLNDLLHLRPGWDGRRAHPPTPTAVLRAIEIFTAVSEQALPPQIFPLPDGGVQLEWHAGASVEIEVDAEGDAHVLVVDDRDKILLNEDLNPADAALLDRIRSELQKLERRLALAH